MVWPLNLRSSGQVLVCQGQGHCIVLLGKALSLNVSFSLRRSKNGLRKLFGHGQETSILSRGKEVILVAKCYHQKASRIIHCGEQ